MTLADLLVYAMEKYQIAEQFKWDAFPRFSVLSDPETGKWDSANGETCGMMELPQMSRPA